MLDNIRVRPVIPSDLPRIKALHDRAFGPGRYVRAAHRVREGMPEISEVCLVAERDGQLIAAIRYTPIIIGGTPDALMLGPLAVEPAFAGQGVGRHLVAVSVERARAFRYRLIILVGDEPYYGKFGFKPVPAGQISMPGPVNTARLLANELEPGCFPSFHGLVAGSGGKLPALPIALAEAAE